MSNQEAQPGSAVTPGMWSKPHPRQPTVVDFGGPIEVGAVVESIDEQREVAAKAPDGRSGRSRWVEYARSLGWDDSALESLSKSQIRALVLGDQDF